MPENPDILAMDPNDRDFPHHLLACLVRALVDLPDHVEIRLVEGVALTLMEVRVHPEDVRRVIGRKGRTANAIRDILTNIGSRVGRRFQLEIMEPEGGRIQTQGPRRRPGRDG